MKTMTISVCGEVKVTLTQRQNETIEMFDKRGGEVLYLVSLNREVPVELLNETTIVKNTVVENNDVKQNEVMETKVPSHLKNTIQINKVGDKFIITVFEKGGYSYNKTVSAKRLNEIVNQYRNIGMREIIADEYKDADGITKFQYYYKDVYTDLNSWYNEINNVVDDVIVENNVVETEYIVDSLSKTKFVDICYFAYNFYNYSCINSNTFKENFTDCIWRRIDGINESDIIDKLIDDIFYDLCELYGNYVQISYDDIYNSVTNNIKTTADAMEYVNN